jgi:hypothetical protein
MDHEQQRRATGSFGAPAPGGAAAAARAPASARTTISTLGALLSIAEHEDPGLPGHLLEGLGLASEDDTSLADQADRLLGEMSPALATTVTFEIAPATGGPDRRLCLECDVELLEPGEFGRFPDAGGFTLRRVFYRRAWPASAEVELAGEDREIAERLAARVVPELAR